MKSSTEETVRFTAEELLPPGAIHPADCRECGGCGWWQDGWTTWPCKCNPNRLSADECFRLQDEKRATHAERRS